MELATERDAEWLSSVVCYEILSAARPASCLRAALRSPHHKDASESQASSLTSRSSKDHEFGSSAGIAIVRLRLRLAAL